MAGKNCAWQKSSNAECKASLSWFTVSCTHSSNFYEFCNGPHEVYYLQNIWSPILISYQLQLQFCQKKSLCKESTNLLQQSANQQCSSITQQQEARWAKSEQCLQKEDEHKATDLFKQQEEAFCENHRYWYYELMLAAFYAMQIHHNSATTADLVSLEVKLLYSNFLCVISNSEFFNIKLLYVIWHCSIMSSFTLWKSTTICRQIEPDSCNALLTLSKHFVYQIHLELIMSSLTLLERIYLQEDSKTSCNALYVFSANEIFNQYNEFVEDTIGDVRHDIKLSVLGYFCFEKSI